MADAYQDGNYFEGEVTAVLDDGFFSVKMLKGGLMGVICTVSKYYIMSDGTNGEKAFLSLTLSLSLSLTLTLLQTQTQTRTPTPNPNPNPNPNL